MAWCEGLSAEAVCLPQPLLLQKYRYASRLPTRLRYGLTGTPFQNNYKGSVRSERLPFLSGLPSFCLTPLSALPTPTACRNLGRWGTTVPLAGSRQQLSSSSPACLPLPESTLLAATLLRRLQPSPPHPPTHAPPSLGLC